MPDIVDKATRSMWMAGIGPKNTRPEMVVRRYLHRLGFRYVLHDRRLPGAPDIVLPRYRVCILVHGCFWHRHEGCRLASIPSSRHEFWMKKFQSNVARDKRNAGELMASGWNVLVLWECGLRRKMVESDLGWLPDAIRNAVHNQPASLMSWP